MSRGAGETAGARGPRRRAPESARLLVCALAVVVAGACTQASDSSGPSPSRAGDDRATTGPGAPAATAPAVRGRWFRRACELPIAQLRRIRRGHYPGRSPDVTVVPARPHFFGGFTVTTHAGPWGYLQRVPLVFYGPGFIRPRGEIDLGGRVTLADVAPTLARLLDVQWPAARPGRPLEEVLVPAQRRAGDLRLIVTVVWDGGGWNVLETWPQAWPHLRRLMSAGTSITNVAVGSSPSVTPAVHTTIGTGAFPKQHGIVDIPLRTGSRMETSFEDMAPGRLRLQTLADLYDRATANTAEVGLIAERSWHLGMLGHGSYVDGGDKDDAVMWTEDYDLVTNSRYYSLPGYLEEVEGFEDAARIIDLEDGRADDSWIGHDLSNPGTLRLSPVWSVHQTNLLKSLIDNEGYGADGVADLLFTNYKDIDLVGHVWNMVNEEMRSTIGYSDDALAKLRRFLDTEVGRGKWVMVVTADHGQAPAPESIGAWPIAIDVVEEDAAKHFGVDANDLFSDERPTGFWLDRDFAADRSITAEELSRFLLGYRIRDNVTDASEVPQQYRDRMKEKLFSAAFPNAQLGGIWACAKGAT